MNKNNDYWLEKRILEKKESIDGKLKKTIIDWYEV